VSPELKPWSEIAYRAFSRADTRAIRALEYPDDGPGGATKYLAVEQWIEINAKRVASLQLPPNQRVLDLGTGCGYFPFVLASEGHACIATDCAKRGGVFRDVTRILGLDVLDVDIAPLTKLPDLGTFDVIASYMITFNGHRVKPWGVEEWRFFVSDCRSRLRPQGRIVLELNREPSPADSCYTPELERFFQREGFEITGHWPHRPERGGHRLVLYAG
jgi:cyclopropane fatty-acyl-phospholipid synthase-like methyltransferase